MGEASPRPWCVSDEDPWFIRDASGERVCDLTGCGSPDEAAANAALIVAAVNAADGAALPGALLAAVCGGGVPCARPLAHAAGCECGAL